MPRHSTFERQVTVSFLTATVRQMNGRNGQAEFLSVATSALCKAYALTIPLQLGYRGHPQNSFPAFAPRFAERLTIGLLQTGHDGTEASFSLAA